MQPSRTRRSFACLAALSVVALTALPVAPLTGHASSHRDAPLLLACPAADITDVYAFVGERDGDPTLNLAMAFNPFLAQQPGGLTIPFDDEVRYEIHVAALADAAKDRPTLSYMFQFDARPTDEMPVYNSGDDVRSNPFQTYSVSLLDRSRKGKKKRKPRLLAENLPVAPPNRGLFTPLYNRNGDGEEPVADRGGGTLDPYTAAAVNDVGDGVRVFAGERDDAFYVDLSFEDRIEDRFEGASPRPAPRDQQAGFNVQTVAVEVPLSTITQAVGVGSDPDFAVGVWATSSRRAIRMISKSGSQQTRGPFRQVSRMGNPFVSKLILDPPLRDVYNTRPKGVLEGEAIREAANDRLAELVTNVGGQSTGSLQRDALLDILFPVDVLRVDLTTPPARRPGSAGYSRLAAIGGDSLINGAGASVPGGWPNGRRFRDDVLDILLTSAGGGSQQEALTDGVDQGDLGTTLDFPFLAPANNPRNRSFEAASTGGGGGEVDCTPIEGFGGVPAVTLGFGFFTGPNSILRPVPGQTYTLQASAFLESSFEPGPLLDVRIELLFDGETALDQTLPSLARVESLAEMSYTVPANATGTLCVEIRVNGQVDNRFPIELGP